VTAARKSTEPIRATMVAAPVVDSTVPPSERIKQLHADQGFIGEVTRHLAGKGPEIVPVSSVLDIDLHLDRILASNPGRKISLQLIGHGISGQLFLAAEQDTPFKYPFHILDTNPAALGLLAKYAGKLSDLTLVGCDVASDTSYGYAINGRTLMFTLADLLQCRVIGATDVVAPNEFNSVGIYDPDTSHRGPSGYDWSPNGPVRFEARAAPSSTVAVSGPNADGVESTQASARALSDAAQDSFLIVAVTDARLPIPDQTWPKIAPEPLSISGRRIDDKNLAVVLPDVIVNVGSLETPIMAQLRSNGRFLQVGEQHYLIDPSTAWFAALRRLLWSAKT
jgi:hypothetical protein